MVVAWGDDERWQALLVSITRGLSLLTYSAENLMIHDRIGPIENAWTDICGKYTFPKICYRVEMHVPARQLEKTLNKPRMSSVEGIKDSLTAHR